MGFREQRRGKALFDFPELKCELCEQCKSAVTYDLTTDDRASVDGAVEEGAKPDYTTEAYKVKNWTLNDRHDFSEPTNIDKYFKDMTTGTPGVQLLKELMSVAQLNDLGQQDKLSTQVFLVSVHPEDDDNYDRTSQLSAGEREQPTVGDAAKKDDSNVELYIANVFKISFRTDEASKSGSQTRKKKKEKKRKKKKIEVKYEEEQDEGKKEAWVGDDWYYHAQCW